MMMAQKFNGLDVWHDGKGARALGFRPREHAIAGAPTWASAGNPVIPTSQWSAFTQRRSIAILDQGNRGACVAHGVVTALEHLRAISGQANLMLSPWGVYPKINGGVDAGASIADGFECIKTEGAPLFSSVPYGIINQSRIPPAANAEAKKYRITEWAYVDTFEEYISGLLLGWIGCWGIGVGPGFNDLDKNGVVRTTSNLNHCVAVGTALKFVDGEWLVEFANSWTKAWGWGGYAWLRKVAFAGRRGECILARGVIENPDESLPRVA